MQDHFAIATLVVLVLIVFSRVLLLKGMGIRALRFGDEDKKDFLILPIYTAFGFVLLGIFLIFPNWIMLLYVFAGFWLFNRQVQREEESLKRIYGEEYLQYWKNMRRYL